MNTIKRCPKRKECDCLIQCAQIPVTTNVGIRRYLRELVQTGLFGNTVEACAERVIVESIERHIRDGRLPDYRFDRDARCASIIERKGN
jgi:hypothetical protein